MIFDRRNFLKFSLALGLTPLVGGAQAAGTPRFFLTPGRWGDEYALFSLDRSGALGFSIPLPSRAHGVTFSPVGGMAVVVARRPDDWLMLFDPTTGRMHARIRAGSARHFYGHAAFSADGAKLYVTANDLREERGLILVYDMVDGFRKCAEWDSGGLGPHEVLWAEDRLAVCNGGMLTRPETGRAALNLADMRPNLSLLDANDGAVRRRMELPAQWRLASIRHLTRLAGGVWVTGLQFQGDSRGQSPLLAICRDDRRLQPLWAPADVQRRLKDYIGSVRADCGGEFFAATAPRGNRVMVCSREGMLVDVHKIRDVCGVAALDRPGAWLLSDGGGGVYRLSLERGVENLASYADRIRWDNHIGL